MSSRFFATTLLIFTLVGHLQEDLFHVDPPAHAEQVDSAIRPSPLTGIENVWRLGPDLYSGGDPGGLEGLRRLKDLGVKTLVSVDGSTPDLAHARLLGLRYVHIPFGYDGIEPSRRVQLARCLSELPKPIFIHCHHGKHRGPAGAAIMARSGLGWSTETALEFMNRAGTSADYPGLYSSVRDFRKLTEAELASSTEPLPESVEVPDMVEMMVGIDTRFDRLKDWLKVVSDREETKKSTIDPIQEAVQLRELVRESARLPECLDKPKAFLESFESLEMDLSRWIGIFQEIKPADAVDADRMSQLSGILKRASGRCVSCHKAFRDK